jgi:LacI family transcriptional regulator
MSQVAELAGVSKNTVSLALRNSPRIPPATRALVEAAAAQLGYQRNAAVGELMAQLRRTGSTQFTPTLALLNANENPHATTQHPTVMCAASRDAPSNSAIPSTSSGSTRPR